MNVLAQILLLAIIQFTSNGGESTTTSSPRTDCYFCLLQSTPANCTGIETDVLHCSTNRTACSVISCESGRHCGEHFSAEITRDTFSNLIWMYQSDCITNDLTDTCLVHEEGGITGVTCFTMCVGVNGECVQEPVVEQSFNISNLQEQLFSVTPATTTNETTTPISTPNITPLVSTIVVGVAIPGGIIALLAIIGLLMLCVYCTKRKHVTRSTTRYNQPSFTVPANSSSPSWELRERIGHGRYGFVYKAEYQGETVAVKIFTSHARNAWETERNLYSMESTAHKNILEYITSEVRGSGISMERALLTRFYPLGSLNNYLRSHTVTWQVACEMIQSIADGLAHLHSEYYTNSAGIVAEKYPIAHRDMKSANVLVRSETGDCVISDLGFAIILDGKQTSNTVQAGTYRYMSPEALDARVNLQDLQSFKQIDVYAFALIMWEIMSRTCVLSEEDVPAYKLPYEEEAGLRPSLERLKDIVVTRKLRPSLPAIWGNHEHLNSLLETLHECWDDDAEARLSAANVSLRLQELTHTNISDINRQESSTAVASLPNTVPPESIPILDMDRPTEHSQSSPPPYYSPTDPSPFQRFQFSRDPNQRHQVSMPHIYTPENEQGYSRMGSRHMSARCTQSLRSSLHSEQEMIQLNNFNRSESLTLRNSLILSGGGVVQEMSNVDEVIMELSQSPPSYSLVESQNESEGSLEPVAAIACGGLEDSGSLDGREVGTGIEFLRSDDSELASNLNSDSGILNTNSELSQLNSASTETSCKDNQVDNCCPSSESDQEFLTSSQDSGVSPTANAHGPLLNNTHVPTTGLSPLVEQNENSIPAAIGT